MTASITHTFVSPVTDALVANEVGPDEWNATHTISGLALTRVDDTNVTLTLGGAPTTALLEAVSLTLGWTGTLAASRGGTGLSALGAGIADFLGTPSSANLRTAVTDETGSGSLVFGTSPTISTGMTLSFLSQNSIPFAGTGGLISQDNTNLKWDNTNKFFNVGSTGTASARINVQTSVNAAWPALYLSNVNTGNLAQLQIIMDRHDAADALLRWNITVDTNNNSGWPALFNIEALDAGGVIASPLSLSRTGHVGIATVPDTTYTLHVAGRSQVLGTTGPQFRVAYDASNTAAFAVDISGNFSVTATGGISLIPGSANRNILIDGGTTVNIYASGNTKQGTFIHNGTNFVISTDGTTPGIIELGKGLTTGSQITSTLATGTAPFVVASTTLVANLHAAEADAAPVGGITGLGTGVATALAVNIGTAGSFITNGGALGSPSSAGTLPALTLGGTVSGGGNQINNVIIGTSTPLAGSFTTVTASTSVIATATSGNLLGAQYDGTHGIYATVDSAGRSTWTATARINFVPGNVDGGRYVTFSTGAQMLLYETANSKYFSYYHDGTNGVITTSNSAAVKILPSAWVHAGTAIPAGGTAGAGVLLSSTSNFGVFFGSGAPTLSAAKGSLYLRSDGSGTGDRAYINTNGGTTWTALTTAA